MTSKAIRNLIKANPELAKAAGKEAFVVLPYAEYRRLLEALEDAADLADLEEAKRENAGKPGIPWSHAKKMLAHKRPARSTRRRKSV